MFDHVHLGWLESDDYRVVAEAAGVVELPDGPQPDEPEPAGPPDTPPAAPDRPDLYAVLGETVHGRWTDPDPGSVGK